MYPTRASYSPLPPNCLRYMCSTPQKQPAAMVAFSAPSGIEAAAAAPLEPEETLIFVDVVKGRRRRERNDGPKDMVDVT